MKTLPPITPKKKGDFDRHQVAGDTERAMLGKPEKFGAADPDDEPAPADDAAGLAPGKPEDAPQGDDKDTQIQQLQAQSADLQTRLERVEQHLKLPPAKGAEQPPAGNQPAADFDDEY